jgi:thioredoxin 1
MAEITLNNDNFEEVIKTNDKVLVDFWATWCGPCKMIAPHIEKIAEERDDIAVGKVNVDDCPEIAIKYNIVSIPTLLIFKDGALSDTLIGYRTKDEIEKYL